MRKWLKICEKSVKELSAAKLNQKNNVNYIQILPGQSPTPTLYFGKKKKMVEDRKLVRQAKQIPPHPS